MKLAVIGSLGLTNYHQLKEYLDGISGITEIVSGAAAGADSLATQYAIEKSIPIKELPADYKTYRLIINFYAKWNETIQILHSLISCFIKRFR